MPDDKVCAATAAMRSGDTTRLISSKTSAGMRETRTESPSPSKRRFSSSSGRSSTCLGSQLRWACPTVACPEETRLLMKKLAAATAAMATLAVVAIGATALATPGTIAPAENLLSPLTSAGRFDEIDARAKGGRLQAQAQDEGLYRSPRRAEHVPARPAHRLAHPPWPEPHHGHVGQHTRSWQLPFLTQVTRRRVDPVHPPSLSVTSPSSNSMRKPMRGEP